MISCKNKHFLLVLCAVLLQTVLEVSTVQSSTCVARSFLYSIVSSSLRNYCDIIAKEEDNANLCDLISSLDRWTFSSRPLIHSNFPLDPETNNFVRRVYNALFSKTNPTPLKGKLQLVAWSDEVLTSNLDLDPTVVNTKKFLDIFSGNKVLRFSTPLAHRYGGHQFGSWAGQLGDGRAHLLGEYVSQLGQRWEIQLKGSGKTPYSRDGDGRAVLRSSIREFLASEAMFYLGVPTSRAGSLIVSEELVKRDPHYNGHVIQERTAVVMRIAPSWFRFGSFEILSQSGEIILLRQLADFIIENYFKDITVTTGSARYLALFSAVVTQTATLIAQWMSRGFAHGVCNTDNFSILSLTIDYGPFRFLDQYTPDMVPNLSDDEQRYSYSKQPSVGRYNLAKLQSALSPLITASDRKYLQQILDSYDGLYRAAFRDELRAKLGLSGECRGKDSAVDDALIQDLLDMMAATRTDFSMTFRQLGDIEISDNKWRNIDYNDERLWALKDLSRHENYEAWINSYAVRLDACGVTDLARTTAMHQVNPRYILRNWIAQLAIQAAEQNDFSIVREIHAVLRNPFTVQSIAEMKGYSARPPAWAKQIKVSCSS